MIENIHQMETDNKRYQDIEKNQLNSTPKNITNVDCIEHLNNSNMCSTTVSPKNLNKSNLISSLATFAHANLARYALSNISHINHVNLTNIQLEKKPHRNPFSLEEDSTILKLVDLFGDNNWKAVTKLMNEMNYDRSLRQCKERYFHYLNPKINKSLEWTNDEDDLLIQKVDKEGKKWKKFEIFFPGRTDVALRNRYNLLIRRKTKKEKKSKKKSDIMSAAYSFLDSYYSLTRRTYISKNNNENNQIEDKEDTSFDSFFEEIDFSDDDPFLDRIQSSDEFTNFEDPFFY